MNQYCNSGIDWKKSGFDKIVMLLIVCTFFVNFTSNPNWQILSGFYTNTQLQHSEINKRNYVPDMNMIVTNSFIGEDRDLTGTLLSIDSQEGVVKLNPSGDVKMLQLKYLCKMKTDWDKSSWIDNAQFVHSNYKFWIEGASWWKGRQVYNNDMFVFQIRIF